MATTLKTLPLIPSKAPNLPIGPVSYDQRYIDNLLNVLRLYFNQLDNNSAGLLSGDGGSYLKFPHIAASDTTDQYAGGNNTPTLVAWNTSEAINGFSLVSGAAIATYPGVYKITYSLQFANTDNAQHSAVVWLKVNGTAVDRSSTEFSLQARKSALIPTYVCAYSEVVFTVAAGDSIELYWATDLAATSGGVVGIYMFADPAQVAPYVRPAIPSAIGSITFVSAVPT